MGFQHALVIADIDKKKIRKVVRKTCSGRKQISLLKDAKIGKWFEQKVMKLVDIGIHYKDGVCWKKREVKEINGGGM